MSKVVPRTAPPPVNKGVKSERRGPPPSSPSNKGASDTKSNRTPNQDRHNGGDRNNDRRQGNKDRGDIGSDSMEGDQLANSQAEKKFTGRCRLFVGNLTNDIQEEDFKKMFQEYAEVSEVFLNPSRGFGFIRLDTRQHAEAAKNALDGTQRNGKILRVRFATHGAALRVKNIPSTVSNELLEEAFSQFGNVERAVVIVDDRGRPVGEGIVEFARKPGAQQALNKIRDGVFMLTSAPRPITVEPLDQRDEEDGYPEKYVPKNNDYKKAREQPPRFAGPSSFEFEFGQRWKQLEEMEARQREQLKKQLEEAREKLDMEMDNAMDEYQANLIRQDLMRRQEELRQLEERRQNDQMRRNREMEMRRQQDEERQRQEEERRRQQEMMMRQQQEELMRRQQQQQQQQQSSMRNRDDHLLMQQAAAIREMESGGPRGPPPMQPPPVPPAGLGLDRPQRHGQGNTSGNFGGGNMGFNRAGNQMGGQGMMGPGGGGGQHMGLNNNQQQPLRQSRFDQPPDLRQGNFGGGGGGGGNLGPGLAGSGPGMMQGGPGGMSGMQGGMQQGGPQGMMGGQMNFGPRNDRGGNMRGDQRGPVGGDRGGPRGGGMDRRGGRDRPNRDDYGDSKRPRY